MISDVAPEYLRRIASMWKRRADAHADDLAAINQTAALYGHIVDFCEFDRIGELRVAAYQADGFLSETYPWDNLKVFLASCGAWP